MFGKGQNFGLFLPALHSLRHLGGKNNLNFFLSPFVFLGTGQILSFPRANIRLLKSSVCSSRFLRGPAFPHKAPPLPPAIASQASPGIKLSSVRKGSSGNPKLSERNPPKKFTSVTRHLEKLSQNYHQLEFYRFNLDIDRDCVPALSLLIKKLPNLTETLPIGLNGIPCQMKVTNFS